MSIPTYNWTWQQGEDLVMSLVYNEGPEGAEEPRDLTGYSLRMDIVLNGTRLYTFNSDDIAGDPDVDVTGSADNEATLGADGSISIVVPREVTLTGGELYSSLSVDTSTVLNYDIFLRDTGDKQRKILRGTITVEPSYTLWQ